MALIEMKRKKKGGKNEPTMPDDEGPTMHLDQDHMGVLGMNEMPQHGDEFHIRGHGKVVHTSESGDKHGTRRHVTLQFREMEARKRGGKSVREEIESAANKAGK